MSQIPLPLSFDKRFSFENYMAPNEDFIRQSLMALFDETGESMVGLYGPADCGKTHLLNACAHYARYCEVHFQLYDAQQLVDLRSTDFSELPPGGVLALDNLDMLAGNRGWEEQLYRLINRVRDGDIRFIFSLSRNPRDIGFRLPDVKSRLMWGLLIALYAPDEDQLAHLLRSRARLLGLNIGDEAINYLLSHFSRKLSDQMELLYRLDRASLSKQRRITIPLIRETCQV